MKQVLGILEIYSRHFLSFFHSLSFRFLTIAIVHLFQQLPIIFLPYYVVVREYPVNGKHGLLAGDMMKAEDAIVAGELFGCSRGTGNRCRFTGMMFLNKEGMSGVGRRLTIVGRRLISFELVQENNYYFLFILISVYFL
ncbi:unnamed protein product [Amaranthus hypochondriacus]